MQDFMILRGTKRLAMVYRGGGEWDKAETAMVGLDLPKDVQERLERRWAQKLQQQMTADQGLRKDLHAAAAPGTQVVRRGKRVRRPPPQAA
jgi:hypothetical protein